MQKFFKEEEKQSFHYPVISEMRKSSDNYIVWIIGIVLILVIVVIAIINIFFSH